MVVNGMESTFCYIHLNLNQSNHKFNQLFTGADPSRFNNARPARVEPATENLLPGNPFKFNLGLIVTVTEPAHGKSNG